MKRVLILIVAGATVAPMSVRAQAARDAREITTDRLQVAADMTDVRRLERLVAELEQARVSGNKAMELGLQQRIGAALRREAAEGRRDVRQDARETGAARREVRRDRATTSPRADDRRDLRDDRRDAAASAGRANRQREIVAELRQIQPQVDNSLPSAVARQRVLLDEFLKVSRDDARASGREVGEDRRELREDMRRP